MPSAQHPQAKFDPLPPDLDLHGLVDRTPNFKWVQRVSRAQIRSLGQHEFEKLIAIHVIAGGKPLVIDGWDSVLPRGLFNAHWFEKTYDKKQENVRDISNATDIPMTTGHYLRSMKQLTNQWTPNTFRDERRQRLYLKDIDCPNEWREMLQKIIHPSLFYLNENVTTTGGRVENDEDLFRNEVTAASAGDLMSSLPGEMQAQNLMCYIGHEGTYTPAHREMCASLGQNIMVEASGDEDGEKPGSSIWFMTESKDREVVREYFLSMLGHDIEIEKHFAQINAWKKAPFDVYIVEQRPGDFILIPPLAAHQVWNRGTRTMKVAWNRTTVETLDLALHEALPRARLVCRDEQYKNKAIIYYTMQKYYRELQAMEEKAALTQMSFMAVGHDVFRNSPRAKQLAGDFKRLFGLFTQVLIDEVFASKETDVELIPFDSCVTCSYCRSNIFNRFLTCKHCVRRLIDGEEDAYDICMECYAMGRSCACLSGLQWCEQWSWSELVDNYETWRGTVIMNDGFVDLEHSPQPLEIARQRSGKKSLAQICQESLKRRPWKDITKPDREKTPADSEPDGEEQGSKKSKKKKKKKGDLSKCHVCCHRDYSYRVHLCTTSGCNEGYCYGVLYRAFDMMPQKVMEDENWKCPKCLGICNCGHCRRAKNMIPYTPKNTSLGHDTRRIADDRSVEALVDFRVHNLTWLKAAGEESRSKNSRRMQRLREQADNAKAKDLTDLAAQVEGQDGMQNGAMPVDQPDGGISKDSMGPATNGYGDQSHVLGHRDAPRVAAPEEGYIFNNAQVQQSTAEAAPATGADTTLGQLEDTSAYPDPSAFARRIGLGYYEQDDTPDKILFDPYLAPSADTLALDEPDVSEYVKKSIRAAKRKAKRENEDPEFVVRSHYKKPRLSVHQTDFLDSMDPALFNEEGPSAPLVPASASAPAPVPSGEQTATGEAVETADAAETSQEKSVQDNLLKRRLRFDANEPSLRHAKPLASYIELEDADIDMEEDAVIVPSTRQAPEVVMESIEGRDDAMDLAAQAVTSLLGGGKPEVASQKSAQKKVEQKPKQASTESPLVPSAFTTSESLKKKRGRPRKSVTLLFESNAESGDEVNLNVGKNRDVSKMADQIPDEAPEATERSRRGRPRRSGVTTIAAASMDFESDVDSDQSWGNVRAPPSQARRRGRPRRSEVTPRASKVQRSLEPSSQFMSMRERMAIRGRGFKIGQRKPRGRTSMAAHSKRGHDGRSSEDPASVLEDGSQVFDRDSGKEGAIVVALTPRPESAIAPEEFEEPARQPQDKIVVSLGVAPGELAEFEEYWSNSADSSGDEDIPSGKVARRAQAQRYDSEDSEASEDRLGYRGAWPNRGRGRGRGRGRVRVRGRGRGRGGGRGRVRVR